MHSTIETICLANQLGSVNCYLVKTSDTFILIDTGWKNRRSVLEKRLGKAGCNKDNLKLIILTHGDFDHSGNCLYFSKKYNAGIAMHDDDLGMVENGDMFWNRKKPHPIMKLLAKAMFKLPPEDRFRPTIFLKNDQDLKEYNADASVIHLPGHSKGSIGILTTDGALICGDLFENSKKSRFNSIMDDIVAARSSLKILTTKKITTIYPGHGKPFGGNELLTMMGNGSYPA